MKFTAATVALFLSFLPAFVLAAPALGGFSEANEEEWLVAKVRSFDSI